MTEFKGILHGIRENGSFRIRRKGKTKEDLQLAIKIIRQFIPLSLIGRIHVGNKIFAGRITELKSNNGMVSFTIINCHRDGTSKEGTKPNIEKVSLDDLTEIEPINFSTDNLWAQYLIQKEKEKNHEYE